MKRYRKWLVYFVDDIYDVRQRISVNDDGVEVEWVVHIGLIVLTYRYRYGDGGRTEHGEAMFGIFASSDLQDPRLPMDVARKILKLGTVIGEKRHP